MKYSITLFLLLSVGLLFESCSKDEDPDPLVCNKTISDQITLGQNTFNLVYGLVTTGSVTVNSITYTDENGDSQTVENPDGNWSMSLSLDSGVLNTFPYSLSVNSSVDNGSVTIAVTGTDGTTTIDNSDSCSQNY